MTHWFHQVIISAYLNAQEKIQVNNMAILGFADFEVAS